MRHVLHALEMIGPPVVTVFGSTSLAQTAGAALTVDGDVPYGVVAILLASVCSALGLVFRALQVSKNETITVQARQIAALEAQLSESLKREAAVHQLLVDTQAVGLRENHDAMLTLIAGVERVADGQEVLRHDLMEVVGQRRKSDRDGASA